MKHPELMIVAAGGISFAGGFAKSGGFPPEGVNVIIGTAAITLLVSATKDTRIAPVVNGLAALTLLAAIYGTVPALQAASKSRSKKSPSSESKSSRNQFIKGR